jgi:hypothetical protein
MRVRTFEPLQSLIMLTPRENFCACAITKNGERFKLFIRNKIMAIYSLDIGETNKKMQKTG